MPRRRRQVIARAAAGSVRARCRHAVRLPRSQYSVTRQGGRSDMPMMASTLGWRSPHISAASLSILESSGFVSATPEARAVPALRSPISSLMAQGVACLRGAGVQSGTGAPSRGTRSSPQVSRHSGGGSGSGRGGIQHSPLALVDSEEAALSNRPDDCQLWWDGEVGGRGRVATVSCIPPQAPPSPHCVCRCPPEKGISSWSTWVPDRRGVKEAAEADTDASAGPSNSSCTTERWTAG